MSEVYSLSALLILVFEMFLAQNICDNIGVTWLITVGWGGWGKINLGKLEKGRRLVWTTTLHCCHPSFFLFAPLQLSSQKKSLGRKNIGGGGGIYPQSPPFQVMPMCDSNLMSWCKLILWILSIVWSRDYVLRVLEETGTFPFFSWELRREKKFLLSQALNWICPLFLPEHRVSLQTADVVSTTDNG